MGVDERKRNIISPYIDDAVLSLGGYITLARDNGIDVSIINMFTQTGFAPNIEGGAERATAARRAEEKLIKDKTGAEIYGLGMNDSPMRGYGLNQEVRIGEVSLDYVFAPNVNDERGTIDEAKDRIRDLISENSLEGRFLAPRGTGFHRDHLIAMTAALELLDEGTIEELALYEDMPYAASSASRSFSPFLERNTRELLVRTDWNRKESLVRVYESQGAGEWIPAMKEYAGSISREKYRGFAERLHKIER